MKNYYIIFGGASLQDIGVGYLDENMPDHWKNSILQHWLSIATRKSFSELQTPTYFKGSKTKEIGPYEIVYRGYQQVIPCG